MRLGPKARILIEVLLATTLDAVGSLTCPSRFLETSTYCDEEDDYRKQWERLERGGWIEFGPVTENGDWVVAVTEKAKSRVTDDIDPPRRWKAEWNGKWHLLVFDLPSRKHALRSKLNRWLLRRRFGHLQGSVWVNPQFEPYWEEEIAALNVMPNEAALFLGDFCGDKTDADIVETSWSYRKINARYKECIRHLRKTPPMRREIEMAEWIRKESIAWRAAFEIDPFLPDALTPKGYLGKQAYELRRAAYQRLLAEFQSEFAS